MECFNARFHCGHQVRVVRNIRNDGSFTQLDKGALLIDAGATGIVHSSGYFLQDQVIYQVYFPKSNRVVGVRDTEVIDATLPWVPCLFRSLDKARLRVALKMFEDIIARKGDVVEVQRVERNLESGALNYEILVGSEHLVTVNSQVLDVC